MKDVDRARLTLMGHRLQKARAKVAELMPEAERIALDVLSDGGTESEIARLLGVDRMTVRKWAGKR